MNIKKNYINIFLIMISLVFSLKFFQSTPIEKEFFRIHAIFIVWAASFLFLFVVSYLYRSKKLDGIIIFYILIMILLPVIAATRSLEVFHQPLLYGILSERNWFSIGAAIWFYHVLRNEIISIREFETTFVFLAWLSLLVFTTIAMTVDASTIDSLNADNSFVVDTENRGIRFKFQMYFITFGAIYYFIKFDQQKSLKYLFYTSLFLVYILMIFQGRTYIIYLALTFLLYYLFVYSLFKLMPRIALVSIFIFIIIIALNMINSSFIDNFVAMFDQMFSVLQGEKSTDTSANSRLIQSDIIINFFKFHPESMWFGTGAVSHQWRDGYEGLFGYFHPIDTGILGGTFVYGVLGIAVTTIYPLSQALKVLSNKSQTNDTFLIALRFLLIFYVLGLLQGTFQFKYTELTIPLFILISISRLQNHGTKYVGNGL